MNGHNDATLADLIQSVSKRVESLEVHVVSLVGRQMLDELQASLQRALDRLSTLEGMQTYSVSKEQFSTSLEQAKTRLNEQITALSTSLSFVENRVGDVEKVVTNTKPLSDVQAEVKTITAHQNNTNVALAQLATTTRDADDMIQRGIDEQIRTLSQDFAARLQALQSDFALPGQHIQAQIGDLMEKNNALHDDIGVLRGLINELTGQIHSLSLAVPRGASVTPELVERVQRELGVLNVGVGKLHERMHAAEAQIHGTDETVRVHATQLATQQIQVNHLNAHDTPARNAEMVSGRVDTLDQKISGTNTNVQALQERINGILERVNAGLHAVETLKGAQSGGLSTTDSTVAAKIPNGAGGFFEIYTFSVAGQVFLVEPSGRIVSVVAPAVPAVL